MCTMSMVFDVIATTSFVAGGAYSTTVAIRVRGAVQAAAAVVRPAYRERIRARRAAGSRSRTRIGRTGVRVDAIGVGGAHQRGACPAAAEFPGSTVAVDSAPVLRITRTVGVVAVEQAVTIVIDAVVAVRLRFGCIINTHIERSEHVANRIGDGDEGWFGHIS